MTENKTAPQALREIPDKMWDAIAHIREIARTDPHYNARSRLLLIGTENGFGEDELIERGIIPPRPKPNPSALKGARH